MTIKNADLPAMPIELNGFGQFEPVSYAGLNKREMFAMAAMQGLCSHSGYYHHAAYLAQDAVMYADALLAELEE